MGMKLPLGALPILQARQRGMRPAHMVIISQIGALPNEANPVVIADGSNTYSWNWLEGLHVCFWTNSKAYNAKHIWDALDARPATTYLWDCSKLRGYDLSAQIMLNCIDFPPDRWEWFIDAIRWLPWQEAEFARGEPIWN